MHRLRCVLLRHETRTGGHFDWMMESPEAPQPGLLATFRTEWAAADWLRIGRLDLLRLAEHRRAYLTREGDISGGRGQVLRVDHGVILPRMWTRDRLILEVHWRQTPLTAQLWRTAADRWTAHVTPSIPCPA